MRLADVVLRRGHLSEAALVEVWSSGVRPAHLDRCDICAERALEISHWLEDVQALGHVDAETVFNAERLTAQHGQIMHRLEQLDRPAKVISFPARKKRIADASDSRRVSPGWLAAAAAAGLAIGVVSVELSHSLGLRDIPTHIASTSITPQAPEVVNGPDAATLFEDPYERTQVGSLSAMDDLTPRLIDVVASGR